MSNEHPLLFVSNKSFEYEWSCQPSFYASISKFVFSLHNVAHFFRRPIFTCLTVANGEILHLRQDAIEDRHDDFMMHECVTSDSEYVPNQIVLTFPFIDKTIHIDRCAIFYVQL